MRADLLLALFDPLGETQFGLLQHIFSPLEGVVPLDHGVQRVAPAHSLGLFHERQLPVSILK